MTLGALFFLSVAGWALALMLLIPRLRAGSALVSALCGMFYLSYCGVVAAQVMPATAYGLMYGGLGGLAAGALSIALNLRGMRSRALTVGMLGYLALSLSCVLLTQNCLVEDHDSLSYWARIVRELFTHERFPINADTTMHHTDYFPMLAALQYCLMRVFGWQDAYLLYATFACVAVSVAAIADLLRGRLWAAAAVVLLSYAFPVFGSSLLSTRADGPMSALFCAGLLCLFMRRDDAPASWLPTLCAAAALTGFKIYTGLMLSLVLCGCMLLSVRGAAKKDPSLSRPLFAMGVLATVLCLALQLSWSGLYHYMTRLAAYEAAVAAAPYTGAAALGETPVFALRDLFTGNPRSEALLNTLSAESLQNVRVLIQGSITDYAQSRLPWLWLFFIPVLPTVLLSPPGERKYTLAALGASLIAGVLYLLGLFASYFVQAETAAAAVGYLTTVTTPLLWALLFILLRAAEGGKAALWGRLALPLALSGMLLLLPPATFAASLRPTTELSSYAALADEYYGYEIADQLTPEDQNKRALLIDCSYAASEIKSESGKTHAYQYFAMPMSVIVLQYRYADYDLLDTLTGEMLTDMLNQNRCDLLLLRVDDDVYWDTICSELSLDSDWAQPTAVYDILREDGQLSFQCRGE